MTTQFDRLFHSSKRTERAARVGLCGFAIALLLMLLGQASPPPASSASPPPMPPPEPLELAPPSISSSLAPAVLASAAPLLAEPAPPATLAPFALTPPPRETRALTAPEDECLPTPLSPTALAEALHAGHILRFGTPPHADRWACAWAQCAFEHARGEAVYAGNIGHVTAPRGQGRACVRYVLERVRRAPDHWETTAVRFRAFDSPAEGAAAYWDLLVKSYYSAFRRCDEADARGAARRLAALGYFTGPEGPYVDGMARLFVHARGVIIPRLLLTERAAP